MTMVKKMSRFLYCHICVQFTLRKKDFVLIIYREVLVVIIINESLQMVN